MTKQDLTKPATAVPAAASELPAQPISAEVLAEKYAKGDERSVTDVHRRVARALAGIETPTSVRCGKGASWRR
jgi:ribonucleoside-diphosphate reductase alpha chain